MAHPALPLGWQALHASCPRLSLASLARALAASAALPTLLGAPPPPSPSRGWGLAWRARASSQAAPGHAADMGGGARDGAGCTWPVYTVGHSAPGGGTTGAQHGSQRHGILGAPRETCRVHSGRHSARCTQSLRAAQQSACVEVGVAAHPQKQPGVEVEAAQRLHTQSMCTHHQPGVEVGVALLQVLAQQAAGPQHDSHGGDVGQAVLPHCQPVACRHMGGVVS